MARLRKRDIVRGGDSPWAKRRRRNVLILSALVVVLSPILFWRVHLALEVGGALATLRAGGIPTTLEALNDTLTPMTAEENGATFYREAVEKFQAPEGRAWENIPFHGSVYAQSGVVLPATMRDAMSAMVKANGESLALLHGGGARGGGRFFEDFDARDGLSTRPYLVAIETMVALLCCDAVLAVDGGESAAAIRSLQTALELVKTLGEEGLMRSLVAQWTMESHLLTALQHGMNRTLWDASAVQPFVDYFSRARRIEAWQRMCDVEQCLYLARIYQGKKRGFVRSALLSVGLGDMNIRAYLALMATARSGLGLSPDEAALQQARYDAIDARIDRHTMVYATLNLYRPANWWAMVRRHWDEIVEAEVALAIVHYRTTRDAWPDNLAALVPDYLDAVGTVLSDGSTLGYDQDGVGFSLWRLRAAEAPVIAWRLSPG